MACGALIRFAAFGSGGRGLFRSVAARGRAPSWVVVVGIALAASVPATAEPGTFESVGVRGGIGFTDGPDSFLAAFDIEGLLTQQFAVGLGLQLGVDDDFIIVSPTLFGRYRFDISQIEIRYFDRIRPFAQLGLGITHIDVDRRGRDVDGTDFMLNFGGGFDFIVNEHVEIGTRMLIDVIPAEVLNQRIYFSWELISVRYRW